MNLKKLSIKKIFFILIIFILLNKNIAMAKNYIPNPADVKVELYLDGELLKEEKDLGHAFIDINTDRTYIPIRFLAEKLGLEVSFISESQYRKNTFMLQSEEISLYMELGSDEALIHKDGEVNKIKVDAEAFIYEDRFYVPVRFISEAFHYGVGWESDGKTHKIKIDTKNPTIKASLKSNLKNKNIEEDFSEYKVNGIKIEGKYIENDDTFLEWNDYRKGIGKSEVEFSKEMEEYAKTRALEEAYQYLTSDFDADINEKYDHYRPDGAVSDTFENLSVLSGKGIYDESPIKYWITSPSHNKNLIYDTKSGEICGASATFVFKDQRGNLTGISSLNFIVK